MTLAYASRGGIPLGNSPWIVFLFVVVVLALMVASVIGTIRQLSAIAATLKVLFGSRQGTAQNPSAPPTVLDGILQLQSFGALRPTSSSGWKIMGGSLQGAATFVQQATLVCAAVVAARSQKNFSQVRPYLSTRLFERLAAEPATPPIPNFRPMTLGTPSIVSHQSSGAQEVQVLRFARPGGAAEDWTFVRGPAAPIPVACPYCGAPAGVVSGTCHYCGAAVPTPTAPSGQNSLGGWVIDDIQPAGSVAA